MTNQEAIDILKRAVAQVEWDYPMEIAAAIDKAIEALQKVELLQAENAFLKKMQSSLSQSVDDVTLGKMVIDIMGGKNLERR